MPYTDEGKHSLHAFKTHAYRKIYKLNVITYIYVCKKTQGTKTIESLKSVYKKSRQHLKASFLKHSKFA